MIPLFASPSLEDRKEFGDDVVENGIRFEEEPSDSYIVRSKSATLRCRTLNALNAWFTCNSGKLWFPLPKEGEMGKGFNSNFYK